MMKLPSDVELERLKGTFEDGGGENPVRMPAADVNFLERVNCVWFAGVLAQLRNDNILPFTPGVLEFVAVTYEKSEKARRGERDPSEIIELPGPTGETRWDGAVSRDTESLGTQESSSPRPRHSTGPRK